MRYSIIISVVLVVLTVAVYWQTGDQGFLSIDDPAYILENQHVTGLSGANVAWAFTSSAVGNWHPLTWLSHMVDVELFGYAPRGHHLTNVVIHSAAALLLFLLLYRLTGAPWPSSFVAALFALHPLHVESVAWIAERKDVLSAFFCFLTLLLYVEYVSRPGVARYLAVLGSLAAGLMAKSMLVTLPVVMLLLDAWPLGRFARGGGAASRGSVGTGLALVREKLPFFACALGTGLIAIATQKRSSSISSIDAMPFVYRLENALVAFGTYLGKTLWPHDMAIFYPLQAENEGWRVFGALALLLLVSATVVLVRRRMPYLAVGWLWYIITLLPVIGIIQVGSQLMADRYTYIPSVGLYIMAAWGVPQLLAGIPWRRVVLAVLYTGAIAGAATLTWQQLGYWKDDVTLFRHALRVTTGNYFIHCSLGDALLRRGEPDGAAREFERAIEIFPAYKKSHNGLGLVLAGRGEYDAAIMEYRQALQLDPDYLEAGVNLGVAYAGKGDMDAAINEFQRIITLYPDNAKVHFNLGLANSIKGNREIAIKEYGEALRIDPQYREAQRRLEETIDGK